MKKLFAGMILIGLALIVVITAIVLTGCNKQLFDTTWNYDYAIIKLPDGTIIQGQVESWNDYEGEQLQVKINGTSYLTSSYNCVLIQK